MSAVIRHQILLTPAQSEALEALADREGVSKAEVVRRALALYDPAAKAEADEIARVVEELRAILASTSTALAETLGELQALRASRDADRQEAREEALTWAQEHPEDLAALETWLAAS
jgi:hypothetical protein